MAWGPKTQKFPPLIFLVNKEIWKTAHEVLESSFMKFLHPWPTAGLWRFWLLPIHEVLMPDTQLEFFMKIFNNLHGVLPSPLCSWGFFIPGFMKNLHALKPHEVFDMHRWRILVMKSFCCMCACLIIISKPRPWSLEEDIVEEVSRDHMFFFTEI